MNWDDPAARAQLIENVGADEYNRRFRQHLDDSTVATVCGHAIRPVSSRFGRIFMVEGTNKGFTTLEDAEKYAQQHPTT